jgi:hypothetical protein
VSTQLILLADLELDAAFQHRVDELNEDAVADYALRCGALPPPVVFHDGSKRFLPGGFHRYAAHERAGNVAMLCDVRPGDWEAAFAFSLGENDSHGLRRTNQDKRKAVRDALEHYAVAGLSDRKVAELCKVGHAFVSNLRREEEELSTVDTTSEPMDTPEDEPPPPERPATTKARERAAVADGPKASVCARGVKAVEVLKRSLFALGGYDLFHRELKKIEGWLLAQG